MFLFCNYSLNVTCHLLFHCHVRFDELFKVHADAKQTAFFPSPHYVSPFFSSLFVTLSAHVFIHFLQTLFCFDRQVYDGENTSSRLLGNFTRESMMGYVVNSTSNHLWLEFNSNASGTNQGFRLTYTSKLAVGNCLNLSSHNVSSFIITFPSLWCSKVLPCSGTVKETHTHLLTCTKTHTIISKFLSSSSWRSSWRDVLNWNLKWW